MPVCSGQHLHTSAQLTVNVLQIFFLNCGYKCVTALFFPQPHSGAHCLQHAQCSSTWFCSLFCARVCKEGAS